MLLWLLESEMARQQKLYSAFVVVLWDFQSYELIWTEVSLRLETRWVGLFVHWFWYNSNTVWGSDHLNLTGSEDVVYAMHLDVSPILSGKPYLSMLSSYYLIIYWRTIFLPGSGWGWHINEREALKPYKITSPLAIGFLEEECNDCVW